jgi:putative transposase
MSDILVQPRRDKRAAKRFFRKLLKGLKYVPRAMITDKLGSYAARRKNCCPWLSIVGIDGLTTERRTRTSDPRTERRMRGFKAPGHAQRFPSARNRIVFPTPAGITGRKLS